MSLIKRNTLLLLLLWPLVSQAHTTNMTTITMALAEDGAFEMVVEFDPGEKILGYQKYYEISRMAEPDQAAALAFLAQALEKEMRVSFDGGRVLLQSGRWTLPNAPFESFLDTSTPTMSQLRLHGSAPARAERLDFTYTPALPLPLPVLFRVDKAGEKLPFSRVVDGPEQPMRTITLFKPPPPLLNETELLVAARLVHGAKLFLAAYSRSLDPGWGAALILLLLSAALVLGNGATDGWARLPLLAAGAVVLAILVARIAKVDLARWQEGINASLAVLAILAGAGVARGLRQRKFFQAVALVAGLLWGVRVAGLPGTVPDPVISAPAMLWLEAMGSGLALLAAALLLHAVIYRLGQKSSYYPRRLVLPAGLLLATVAGCWLVDSLRHVS